MPGSGQNGALGVLVAFLCTGCARDTPAPPPRAMQEPGSANDEDASPWWEDDDPPDLPTILAALGRSHATVRSALGPHHLQFEAHFQTTPSPEAPALPPVDERTPRPAELHDTLTMDWASDEPRYTLSQHNDAGRGRNVVRVADTLYTQLEHRRWHHAPIESEIDELWLDDAYRSAFDALSFAASALRLEVRPDVGAENLAWSLHRRDPESDDPVEARGPRAAWREATSIDAIEGELVIDRTQGTWRSLRLSVRYRIDATQGSIDSTGRFEFDGTLEPLSSPPPIAPPSEATPFEDRRRLEEEKRSLLEGLARL